MEYRHVGLHTKKYLQLHKNQSVVFIAYRTFKQNESVHKSKHIRWK